ncbi:hypothetical protein HF290_16970 [Acidithiobacillus ferrooxidans]|uniref:hypothetical protein n=1 Tax=Acidithiobacillus ferrooxidans TaxID=920 RepID=UPI001C067BC5|nr:hypothetical protein [Acidithiobacillus ferrooxidans]MBU2862008.1 hypothetical protein [Acidithiobacillus ferrooxidans]
MEEREADIVRYVTQQALLGNATIVQDEQGVNYMRSGSRRCPLAAITNPKAFYTVHARMRREAARRRGLHPAKGLSR